MDSDSQAASVAFLPALMVSRSEPPAHRRAAILAVID